MHFGVAAGHTLPQAPQFFASVCVLVHLPAQQFGFAVGHTFPQAPQLYYVVELVQALLEREVRRRMQQEGQARLALYPEGRPSEAPTAGLVLSVLEGHRRHRLLDEQGQELRRFHDPVSDAAWDVLTLLDVDPTVYGLD